MNDAERLRDERLARMDDLSLLRIVTAEPRDELISKEEFNAFIDMNKKTLRYGQQLSTPQRSWVEAAARRVTPLQASEVPRGLEVLPPAVLQKPLPKHPPGRTPR
jgi:hypothetical protein